MNRKIIIKLPKMNILKETPEERKQRVRSSGKSMITKIVPDKKHINKKKQRQLNKKEVDNYNV